MASFTVLWCISMTQLRQYVTTINPTKCLNPTKNLWAVAVAVVMLLPCTAIVVVQGTYGKT